MIFYRLFLHSNKVSTNNERRLRLGWIYNFTIIEPGICHNYNCQTTYLWYNSFLTSLLFSHHGVWLSWTCLAIRKDTDVVTEKQKKNQNIDNSFKPKFHFEFHHLHVQIIHTPQMHVPTFLCQCLHKPASVKQNEDHPTETIWLQKI